MLIYIITISCTVLVCSACYMQYFWSIHHADQPVSDWYYLLSVVHNNARWQASYALQVYFGCRKHESDVLKRYELHRSSIHVNTIPSSGVWMWMVDIVVVVYRLQTMQRYRLRHRNKFAISDQTCWIFYKMRWLNNQIHCVYTICSKFHAPDRVSYISNNVKTWFWNSVSITSSALCSFTLLLWVLVAVSIIFG